MHQLAEIPMRQLIKLLLLTAFIAPTITYAAEAAKPDAMQEYVMKQGGTEQPYKNKYWDNKAEGIYVDAMTGKPLFSSTDKYDSGTGWPSFTRPIDANDIIKKTDNLFGLDTRIEVKSKSSDGHLGHVFEDGPKEKGGLRYCINSAAMRFVPKADLAVKGYGKYVALFGE